MASQALPLPFRLKGERSRSLLAQHTTCRRRAYINSFGVGVVHGAGVHTRQEVDNMRTILLTLGSEGARTRNPLLVLLLKVRRLRIHYDRTHASTNTYVVTAFTQCKRRSYDDTAQATGVTNRSGNVSQPRKKAFSSWQTQSVRTCATHRGSAQGASQLYSSQVIR